MIIKKFVGKNEAEAVSEAQKELGKGIVIMNVKNVKRKGLRGLFGAKQVEVTVALEEEDDTLDRKKNSDKNKSQAKSEFGDNIAINKTNSQANASKTGPASTKELNRDINEKNTSDIKKTSENIEKKLDSLQSLLENQFKSSDEKTKDNSQDGYASLTYEKEEKVAEETKEQEENQTENSEEIEQKKFIKLIYDTLIDNEVDEKIADEILDEIDKIKKPNIPLDYLLANIYQKMILKFGMTEGITPCENGPKVVLFLGPTGVGKTTTIAKIASNFNMEQKKKVALLTADTYRIAAAEQLRTYANILEVPFRVIYTADEIKEAIEDFQSFDYIFVDTAGHSHQNEEQLKAMSELITAVDSMTKKDIFLVLSATTKYRDLLRIAESYSKITKYKLIFTKLDETSAVGNLLNIKLKTDSVIAYVTCGQNVPDDIEHFNAQKTVKQLLGGK